MKLLFVILLFTVVSCVPRRRRDANPGRGPIDEAAIANSAPEDSQENVSGKSDPSGEDDNGFAGEDGGPKGQDSSKSQNGSSEWETVEVQIEYFSDDDNSSSNGTLPPNVLAALNKALYPELKSGEPLPEIQVVDIHDASQDASGPNAKDENARVIDFGPEGKDGVISITINEPNGPNNAPGNESNQNNSNPGDGSQAGDAGDGSNNGDDGGADGGDGSDGDDQDKTPLPN